MEKVRLHQQGYPYLLELKRACTAESSYIDEDGAEKLKEGKVS